MTQINIESGLFNGLRYEINEGLTAVINKMIETVAEDGSLSVKINIGLYRLSDKDSGEIIYKPSITWKVGTAVKLTENITGETDTAGKEMIFDRDSFNFALKDYGKQESLFEE